MAARKPQDTPDTTADQQQPVHSPEALQRVWDAADARRNDAVHLAEQLAACDAYIGRTQEALAKAEADRVQIAERHAAVFAEANGLRAMVVEYCGTHQLPLPQTPAAQAPALEAALADLDDRARKHPAPVMAPVRARSMTEITHLADRDPYAHLLGARVKVVLRDQIEVLSGTLQSLDNGEGRLILLDQAGQPYWWPQRSQVERIEPLDDSWPHTFPPDDPQHRHDLDAAGNCWHPGCGYNSEVERAAHPQGYGPTPEADDDPLNGYGQLPPRPDVAEQSPAAEAHALAAGPKAWLLLAVGVRLAAPSARRRAAWARSGHWRHRAGSLTSGPVRLPSGVRGATV